MLFVKITGNSGRELNVFRRPATGVKRHGVVKACGSMSLQSKDSHYEIALEMYKI